MTIKEIEAKIQSSEYDFLRTNPHLGNNIMLLGLGGSHAYGTSTPNSDIDLRGIATRAPRDILTGYDWESTQNRATDTVIYSFDKMISLLAQCNPNTIEILGLKPEHYIHMTPIGEELVANASMFLSKRAVHTFGSYAKSQLRRLENAALITMEQARQEEHILKSIEYASHVFRGNFQFTPEDAIKLFIAPSDREDMDSEIFMDLDLKHYPLRDWLGMWAEMKNIASSYNKIGQRNANAISHDKLGKHQMHLTRLYFMAFDILEDGKIITYREKEHDFLMDIRNGKYLNENMQPTKEFKDVMDELDAKLDRLANTSPLPAKPDMDRINDFVAEVNGGIVYDAQARDILNTLDLSD